MINGITIGADPELFIVDNNNKVISAVGLIPGEKGKPYVADDMPKGFGMEIDNILGEFNIPPVKLKSGFVNNINYMKNYIDNFVKQINPNYGIQCIASRMVDDDQLQSDEAKLFGCMPDYNVYTEKKNKKPNAKNQNLRSAGQVKARKYRNIQQNCVKTVNDKFIYKQILKCRNFLVYLLK